VVPDPQELDSFARSKLDWSELCQPAHAELFEWYRRLIRLRRAKAADLSMSPLKSMKVWVDFDAEAEWLSFCHHGLLAVFNLRGEAQSVPLPIGDWELALRSDLRQAPSDLMPAQTTFIYIRAKSDLPRGPTRENEKDAADNDQRAG
jgi:maltooligosyltrehalose trehalohydrolase